MDQSVVPQFRITSLRRSLAFYVDGLGFAVDWEHRFEPGCPAFVQISRHGQKLFLTEHDGDCRVGGAAYFVVPDVDACGAEFAARGVEPTEPPEDKPWGPREMVVTDPDGNRLRFASQGVPSGADGSRVRTLLTATLSVRGWERAVSFYRAAFGATEVYRVPGGGVSRLSVSGSEFWVAEEAPEHGNPSPETLGGSPVRMLLIVRDPVETCREGVKAGASLVSAVADAHGWLLGRIADPFGHHWEIGRPLGGEPVPSPARPPGARAQPLIAVADVEESSRWYRHLFGWDSAHGGSKYDRLESRRELVLQLHRWDVEHHHGPIGDPGDRPYGNGVLLWFEVDDFDAVMRRAAELRATVVRAKHRNPPSGAGGPDHWETWIRDPDGYTVVVASPDGSAGGGA